MSRASPVKRASSANRVAHLITSYKQDLNLIKNNEGVEKNIQYDFEQYMRNVLRGLVML